MSPQYLCCYMCTYRPAVKFYVEVWWQFSTKLLRHLPTILIVLVLTLSRSNDMTPPARIQHVLILVSLKLTCGNAILTASQSTLVISVLLIVDHFPFLDTSTSVMRSLAPYLCICATHLLIAATTHAWGCLVLMCLNDLLLTPLLCSEKKRLTKLAIAQV